MFFLWNNCQDPIQKILGSVVLACKTSPNNVAGCWSSPWTDGTSIVIQSFSWIKLVINFFAFRTLCEEGDHFSVVPACKWHTNNKNQLKVLKSACNGEAETISLSDTGLWVMLNLSDGWSLKNFINLFKEDLRIMDSPVHREAVLHNTNIL